MYIYHAFKGSEKEPFSKSCYLPTIKESVLEDMRGRFTHVRLSEKGSTVRVIDKNREEINLRIVSSEGEQLIMYIDDEAEEFYRIEKEKL